MSRRPRKSVHGASTFQRTGVLNAAILAGIVVTFLLVPLFITRSIVSLEPEQGVGVLALIGALVVALLPLHDRPVNTRIFLYMLAIYVALYACWPNYVAIELPFLPIITPARALLMALVVMWVFIVATSRTIHDRLWQRLKIVSVIWIALLVLLVFRGLAIPFAVTPSAAAKGFFDQIISLYMPLMIAVTLISSEKDVRLIIKAIVLSALFIGLTVIPEWFTRDNLFVNYLGKNLDYRGTWIEMVLEMDERNGKYRAQGPFMVHLSMAEYFAMTLPFVLYWIETVKTTGMRVFLIGMIGLCLFTIFATDSRTAIIVGGLVIGVYLTFRGLLYSTRNPESNFRPVIALLALCVVVLIPVALVYGFENMDWRTAFGETGTRSIQMQLAIPKILERPIIGYGTGLAGLVLDYKSNGRDLTIDSYYLSVALDAGLPGLAAFLVALGTMWLTALRNAVRPGPFSGLYLAFFLYFTAFGLLRTTLSESGNLTLTHMMMGAFIAFHWIGSTAKNEPKASEPRAVRGRRRRAWSLTRKISAA